MYSFALATDKYVKHIRDTQLESICSWEILHGL